MSRAVQHNKSQQRFEWLEDGQLSVLDYRLENGVIDLVHTSVPEALGGRGIAADLTRTALETARKQGWRVRPLCSYVAGYIRRKPEYQDLLA